MTVDARDAQALIGDVERVRCRSRARASTMWFPLVLFGAISLLSAGIVVSHGAATLGAYWSVAGPAGGVATGVHAAWWGRRVGVETWPAPYLWTAVGVLAGALAIGLGGDLAGRPMVSAVGPWLVISLGYLRFAWLERSRVLGTLAVALAAVAVALPLTGVAAEPVAAVLAALYGAVFLATGLRLGLRGRRP